MSDMRIKCDFYLDWLIKAKGDGFVKILTGIRTAARISAFHSCEFVFRFCAIVPPE